MKWYYWFSLAVIILTVPVVLLEVILSPNEYMAQGLKAVDCDGPLIIMALAIPCYFIYGLASIGYIVAYRITRKPHYLLAISFSILMIAVITPNVISAVKEHNKNQLVNKETCGNGW